MQQDTEYTRVMFRRYTENGTILAVFPDQVADPQGRCGCYAHIGQHGAADYDHVLDQTRPATEAEYTPLKRELEGIGYRLRIRRRR